MSDSEESGVTYTDISSPFEELSDIGSPRADDHGHLMLPEMLEDPYVEVTLQAPPSPDYIPGPEEPEQAPPSPDYVQGPEHADDEIDDDNEDPEEDPVDYPADGRDDGDDKEESSKDEEDDEIDVKADEEEEEYPAPADSRLPYHLGRELGGYVREFETRVRQVTDEIYTRLDDEQTERQLLAGQLNMLFKDRRAHAYTRQLMETEARMSREAWVRATDASDLVHGKVISLRTTVLGQISEIRDLQAADRRRQTVILELLKIDHRRSTETSELRTAL
nr:hypothetical protein [Tanacetum cinerariifolium]